MKFATGLVFGAALASYVILLMAGLSGIAPFLPQATGILTLDRVLSTLAFVVAVITAYANWTSSRAANIQSEITKSLLEVSRAQAQAAMLPKRLEIYEVVRDYLTPWAQHGHPDLERLPSLVRAWETAQFLFDADIVSFIRQVWLDSLNADMSYRISTGEIEGDKKDANKKTMDLFLKYFGAENNQDSAHIVAFRGMRLDAWKYHPYG